MQLPKIPTDHEVCPDCQGEGFKKELILFRTEKCLKCNGNALILKETHYAEGPVPAHDRRANQGTAL